MAKRLVLSVLVFLAVFAVACGGAAPTTLPEATATSAPTPDIPATVAAEVEAALAAAANAESTATPAPDLQEAQPTATPLPQSSAGNLPPSSILPTSVAAVQIVPGSALLVEGETKQLESLVAGGAGNQLNGRPVAWASSNSAIARISGTGLVTGALAGLTNVTAIVEGVAAAAIIEVRHGPVASLEIALGNGAQLIATLQDAAGHPLQDRVVTWSSNRPDVLQVDPGSGALAVGALGAATITATAEGVSAAVDIQVSNESVTTVTVAPETVSLEIGSALQLSAAPQNSAGQLLSDRNVTWSSSNDAVAQVTATGMVTAVSVGISIIIAASEGVQGTSTVTVTSVAIASIALSSDTATMEEGQSVQLSAVSKDASGQVLTGRSISWSSSDETVARVSANGLVTGVSAGAATVSGASEGVSATATFEVTHGPVASVEIGLGAGSQLVATLGDVSGHLLLDRAVAWSSSDTAVLGVEAQTGLFTVGTVGDVTVTATAEGITASVTLTVNPEPVESVRVTPDPAELEVDASIQLVAAPKDGAGNLLTGRTVVWTSSRESVATVSDTGLVIGVSAGDVFITATVEGRKWSTTVTVSPRSVIDYGLLWSVAYDRFDSLPLEGASVSGQIYVFTGPDQNVDGVSFYLDDPGRQSDPYRSESAAPYDLAGTHRDGTAQGFDTSQLSPGSHSITAEITLMNGTTVAVTANFNVAVSEVVPPPLTPVSYRLLWSVSSNRSNPALLEGATVPETVYVFSDPAQGVVGVSFYLDDPNRHGSPYRSERAAPYDLAGTLSNGNANGYDTGQLSNGVHTITVGITLADGSTVVVTVTFSVETPVVVPPPPLPPESYELRWSSSSNRGYYMRLAGDTVSGNIYVYTGPDQGVDSVSFYLDDPDRQGSPYRSESTAPYDLGGTLNDGRARPFDSSQLGIIGAHNLTAEITFTDGTTTLVDATFSVAPTPVTSIEIDPQSAIVAVGNIVHLTPTLRNASGNPLTDREVIWTSSNPAVTVSVIGPTFYSRYFENGNGIQDGTASYGADSVSVYGNEAGETAVITATADGVSASVVITVIFPFSSVSAGAGHTCGVTPAGDAYCWGFGNSGRLGYGGTEDQALPVPVNGGHDFKSISAGDGHTCGITFQDDAYCWGSGNFGRLGNGSTENQLTPQPVSGGLKFKSISPDGVRTCGITTQNEAYCWGSGHNGGLGNGSTANQSVPVAVLGNHDFKSISASAAEGGNYVCGVTKQGDAYCWGRGWSGQLGDGADGFENIQDEPVAVLGGHKFTTVSTGNHTCGLTTLGKIYCWGLGRYGQLGNGSDGNGYIENEPVIVSSGRTFRSLDVGSEHTCAITVQGKTYCWGQKSRGRLGIGVDSSGSQTTPALVSGGHTFTSVSAGGLHTCGVTTDDEAYCWGRDLSNQLGNGPDTANEVVPDVVAPPIVIRNICRIDAIPSP